MAQPIYSQSTLHCLVQDQDGQFIQEVNVGIFEKKDILNNNLDSFNNSFNTKTDSSGQFWVENLKEGIYLIKLDFFGYENQIQRIEIKKNVPHIDLQFTLKSLFQQLQTIEISDNLINNLSSEKANKKLFLENLAGNFSQTLSNLAGVQSINVGVGIAKPVIRGLAGNRILVLNDGIKQEGQQWGNDHGLEIDALDVETMELVKGAASLQYGSDAIAGLLVVNPVKIPVKNSLSASLLTLYKTNNEHTGISAQFSQRKSSFFYQFRYSKQDYSDYQIKADSFIYNGFRLPIYGQRLKNTAGNENNLRFSFGYVSDKQITRISTIFYSQNSGLFMGAVAIPRAYSLQPDNSIKNIDVPKQKVYHFRANLHHFQQLKHKKTLTLDVGYQQNRRQEYSFADRSNRPPVGSRSLALDLLLKTISVDLTIKRNYQKNSFLYGIQSQYQYNTALGFEFLIPSYRTARTGIFIINNWQPKTNHFFTFGLRADANAFASDDFKQQVFNLRQQIITVQRSAATQNAYFNYAAGFGWVYKPVFTQKIAKINTNFGKSFRSPTMNELASDGVHHGTFRHERGNFNLRPEQGYQFDLGIDFVLKKDIFNFKVSSFANFFQDFIFLRPSGQFSNLPEGGQIYQYSQADVFHTGGELQLNWQPNKFFNFQQSWEYVFNYNLNTGLGLPFTPPLNILTDFNLNLQPFWGKKAHFYNTNQQINAFIKLSYLYSAAQNRVDRNELATRRYHLINISANVEIPFKKGNKKTATHQLYCSFQVQNLLNNAYLQHLSRYRLLGLPEQGRNFVFSLFYQFGMQK